MSGPPGDYGVVVVSTDPATVKSKKCPLPPEGAWFPLSPDLKGPNTSGLKETVTAGKPLAINIP